jgi:hypothetical protein
MKRRGLLRTGQSFQWRWNFQGVPCGSMSVLTEADALVLMFRSLGPSGRELSFVRQRVAIAWTPRHLGGGRPWFICGAYCAGRSCGKRVAVLYSVGDLFACRNCCDIAYASQRESPKFRDISRARKIRMRLGGSPDLLETFPEKPPRMHSKTYLRLRKSGEAADARAFEHLQRPFEA